MFEVSLVSVIDMIDSRINAKTDNSSVVAHIGYPFRTIRAAKVACVSWKRVQRHNGGTGIRSGKPNTNAGRFPREPEYRFLCGNTQTIVTSTGEKSDISGCLALVHLKNHRDFILSGIDSGKD